MKNKGFTIIESLIAVSVLTLSITGATSIVQQSLNNSARVQAKAQAIGLAVEGVEYMRNLRDRAVLEQGGYNNLTDLYNFVDTCRVDGCAIQTNNLDSVDFQSSYSTDHEQNLNLTAEGYELTGAPGSETSYQRVVKVVEKGVPDGREFEVISQVSYSVRGVTETIDYKTLMYLPNN